MHTRQVPTTQPCATAKVLLCMHAVIVPVVHLYSLQAILCPCHSDFVDLILVKSYKAPYTLSLPSALNELMQNYCPSGEFGFESYYINTHQPGEDNFIVVIYNGKKMLLLMEIMTVACHTVHEFAPTSGDEYN